MANATDADLSIVFQGPIFGKCGDPHKLRYTKIGLQSARKHFPRAELILSTWQDMGTQEFVGDLDLDALVLSRDPGSELRKDNPPTYHNVNRQIVSSQNGLKKASRRLAIKARSDTRFKHGGILEYWDRYVMFDRKYKIFQSRVCVSHITTINPGRLFPLPYHVCDWFFFGLKSDLMDLFDIPNFPEPLWTRWYKSHPKPPNDFDPLNYCRYMPEDYVWSSFLGKYRSIDHAHYCHISPEIIEDSERYLTNNVVVLPNRRLGIESQKYTAYHAPHLLKCYTWREWEQLYHRYAGGPKPSGWDLELLHNYVAHYVYEVIEPFARALRRFAKKIIKKNKARLYT